MLTRVTYSRIMAPISRRRREYPIVSSVRKSVKSGCRLLPARNLGPPVPTSNGGQEYFRARTTASTPVPT